MCRVIRRVCNCCELYRKWLESLSLTKFLRVFYISLLVGISLFSYGVIVKEMWTFHIGIVIIIVVLTFAISYIKCHRCEG